VPDPPTASTRFTVGRRGRQVGYALAVAGNVLLLFIVNNLLEWEFPSFLTADWDRVLPILNVSLIVSIIVNATFIAYDARWFKSLGQVVMAAFSLAVVVRLRSVFPFDFTPYDFNWEAVTKWILVFMIIALVISIIAEGAKGLRALTRLGAGHQGGHPDPE
jgi:hypothetical protein